MYKILGKRLKFHANWIINKKLSKENRFFQSMSNSIASEMTKISDCVAK